MFAYVAAVTLLGIGPIVSPWQDSILASAFLCNVFGCGRSFWHFWSLSVEEQFYLLWPLLFVLLDWRGALVAVVVGLTCSALALGVMGAWLDNGLSFACIGVGALYALSEPFRRCFAWAKTLPAWLFPALLIGAVPYVRSRWGGTLVLPFVIVAAVLVRHEDGSFGKASRPLLFLGAVSFSLYLWQGPMTWEAERYSSPGAMYAVTALAIVATWVSYRWVERPMIRLAHRLTSRAPS